MILMLYLQQNLDVILQGTSARGQFKTRAQCEDAAVRLRGPLPVPRTYSAAWQDVLCVPIQRNVRVNDAPSGDLAKVLRQQPGTGCQAEGAWRRMTEMCQGAPR